MGSYREYLIDSQTNWQEVQNQIAAALPQVQNPVNDVKVPTLTDLSGGFATGIGTWGNTYGIPPAPPESINTVEAYQEPPPSPVRVPERDVVSLAQENVSAETITNLLLIVAVDETSQKFHQHHHLILMMMMMMMMM